VPADFCGFVKQLPGAKCPQAALATAIQLFEMYAPRCRGYLHTLAGACPLKNTCALRHAPAERQVCARLLVHTDIQEPHQLIGPGLEAVHSVAHAIDILERKDAEFQVLLMNLLI
jgi:ADP-ribosylglycohydrolase